MEPELGRDALPLPPLLVAHTVDSRSRALVRQGAHELIGRERVPVVVHLDRRRPHHRHVPVHRSTQAPRRDGVDGAGVVRTVLPPGGRHPRRIHVIVLVVRVVVREERARLVDCGPVQSRLDLLSLLAPVAVGVEGEGFEVVCVFGGLVWVSGGGSDGKGADQEAVVLLGAGAGAAVAALPVGRLAGRRAVAGLLAGVAAGAAEGAGLLAAGDGAGGCGVGHVDFYSSQFLVGCR